MTSGAISGAQPPASSAAVAVQTDQQKLDVVLAKLESTESGAEVVAWLRAHDMPLDILPDATYACARPGFGGSFENGRMKIPSGSLNDANWAATLIAHETQHAMDGKNIGFALTTVLGALPLAALDGVVGLLHGRNPVSAATERVNVRLRETEVHAYHRQAEVAGQLGLNQSGWSHGQREDGSVKSDTEIRDKLAKVPLYQSRMLGRAFLGTIETTVLAGTALLASRFVLKHVVHDPAVLSNVLKWSGRGIAAAGVALLAADLIGWHRYLNPPAPKDGGPAIPPLPAPTRSIETCEREVQEAAEAALAP